MASPRVPECFVCPISSAVMRDPYCTVDGFSYERAAIEAWLARSDLSPMTGQPLPLTILIPNKNLKLAISLHFSHQPEYLVTVLPPSPERADRGFSQTLLGACVALAGSRVVRRLSVPQRWSDAAVFIDAPLKGFGLGSRVDLEIVSTCTEWGGMLLGVSPLDFRSSTDRLRLLEETAFCLDGQGWFSQPHEGAVLSGWNSADLKAGDQVTMELPPDGGFVVLVNGEKKVDLRDARLPAGPLFAFIALSGNCEEVRLITP